MPQRFLRPGLTTSQRFNAASWQAQSLYVRLITLVDDYGRFEAHPMLLKSLAFPFNPEITCEQMILLCEQLLANDLADFYEKDGKKYLQLSRWQEKARSHSKFPSFDDEACKHLLTFANNCSAPSPSPSPSPSPKVASLPDAFELHPNLNTPEFKAAWKMWLENLKQRRKTPTIHARDLQLSKLSKFGHDAAIQSIKNSIESGWQGLFEPKPEKQPEFKRSGGGSGSCIAPDSRFMGGSCL